MIDLRPIEEYNKKRLKSSSHFPLQSLQKNLFSSLPPISTPLTLIGHPCQLLCASQILLSRNWKIQKTIDISEVENKDCEFENQGRGERLWRANLVLEEQIEVIEECLEKRNGGYGIGDSMGGDCSGELGIKENMENLIIKQNSDICNKCENMEILLGKQVREICNYPENMQNILNKQQNDSKNNPEKMENTLKNKSLNSLKLPQNIQKKALDIGCGRGRDTIFLSQRGWSVTALDNQSHFLNAIRIWQESENLQNIQYIQQNLENNCEIQLNYDLYVFSRFMNYQLLRKIVEGMEKGSFVLVVHFVQGKSQNKKQKDFKDQSQLINQEFYGMFQGFKIFQNKEVLDESGLRYLSYFLAQKN